jgi:hypothetical protein
MRIFTPVDFRESASSLKIATDSICDRQSKAEYLADPSIEAFRIHIEGDPHGQKGADSNKTAFRSHGWVAGHASGS